MAEDDPSSGLDRDKLIAMYYYMVLARALAKQIGIFHRPGRVGQIAPRIGDEAAQVAAAMAFEAGRDILCLRYHDLGAALALGMSVEEVVWNGLVSANDPHSGGRQKPARQSDAARHVMMSLSPVGTQILRATGKALAVKWHGEPVVVGAFCSQGSASRDDFAEGLKFAELHRLPTVFICPNTGGGVADITGRVREWGMRAVEVDGTHPLAVYGETKVAVNRAREGIGPTFLDVKVVRWMTHRGQDDQHPSCYLDEPDAHRIHDPLLRFRQWMESERLWDAGQEHRLRERLIREMHDASNLAQSFLAADLKSV